ncbi:hypothetical protein KFL_006340200 [Klebsormidium nitens]|uniref:Uncharacterized protein n=1 Tax=Klebsormidium nitens TaxID=105231 RepID=A0A1Y1IJT5_KLENI|nr:hypothetical protein KFL_006340200 [Klebsormidium nitens]|eukprot:GAQ90402.1 hypothetical protein KFL_006340200 [Klebsormidium nitens]
MVPKRTRSARCAKSPEKILRFFDDSEEADKSCNPEADKACCPGASDDEHTEEKQVDEAPLTLQGKTIAIVDVGFSCKDYLAEAGAAGGPHRIADEGA